MDKVVQKLFNISLCGYCYLGLLKVDICYVWGIFWRKTVECY